VKESIPTEQTPEFDARKAIERRSCRYDPARLLHGFETIDEAVRRDERLVSALRRSDPIRHRDLKKA